MRNGSEQSVREEEEDDRRGGRRNVSGAAEEEEEDDDECLVLGRVGAGFEGGRADDDMSMDEEEPLEEERGVEERGVEERGVEERGMEERGMEERGMEERFDEESSEHYLQRDVAKSDRESLERSAAKRRKVSSSSGRYQNGAEYEGGVGSGRSARDELFEDTRGVRLQVDRRLEKAVAAISLDLLEAVRLGQKRLLHMLDHPRFEEYIRGTYVRYPDLELLQGEMNISTEKIDRFLPAQITKCLPSTSPKRLEMEGISKILPFEMTILQYTQRSDGSLKIRKTKLDIKLVSNVPFKPDELAEWRNLLRLFTGRAGSDKLQTLPEMLKATALRLKDFTFTAEDVDTILKRKSEKQLAGGSSLLVLNWRDLYLRKSELEFQIQELRGIEEDEDFVASLSVDDSAKLQELENELNEVKKRLAVLKKEEEDKANQNQAMEQLLTRGVDPTHILPSHTGRVRNKVDTQMLTPRFLQAKAAVNVPSPALNRTLDWSTLDYYKKMTRLAWTVGNVRPDSHRPSRTRDREALKANNDSLIRLSSDSLLAASSFPLATSTAPEILLHFPLPTQNVPSGDIINWNDFVEESTAKLSQRA